MQNARLACAAAGEDDILILTDAHALSGSMYCLRRAWDRRRPTIVRADPLLTPANCVKRAYVRSTLRAVDRLIVWAPAVVDRYHNYFGVPREMMVPLRFHHTLIGHEVQPEDGNYIFSGGDSLRDYPTLLKAVAGLDIPVIIATRLKLSASVSIPSNVVVKPVSAGEFRKLMAGARLVVFPLRTDAIRTSGQQSYLNAMALGKPVIVTDTTDAPYYIEHEKTGVLAPSGDAAALREAIGNLLDEPEKAAAMGEAAKAAASALDQEYTWGHVLRMAVEVHEARVAKRIVMRESTCTTPM